MRAGKILLLWCFTFLFCFAQGTRLSVRTSDSQSKIYLNDHLSGVGRVDTILPAGTYNIRVEENSINWNRGIIIDTVILTGNSDIIEKTYSFPLRKRITTIPHSAEVFSGTTHYGYTPIEISEDVTLTLRLRGFRDSEIRTDSLELNSLIYLQPLNSEMRTEITKSPLLKYLVGGIILFGGTAAYFKLKADIEFDRYKSGGDKSLLDATRKYDLISGISFGLFQVNFGVLIYYFLEEN